MLFIAIHSMQYDDDDGSGGGHSGMMLRAACYSCHWYIQKHQEEHFLLYRSDYDDSAWVFPLISSVLILNSFSFFEDLSFQLFIFFRCSVFTLRESEWMNHYHWPFHMQTQNFCGIKWDYFTLFDEVLFILQCPLFERKKQTHTATKAKKYRIQGILIYSNDFPLFSNVFISVVLRLLCSVTLLLFVGKAAGRASGKNVRIFGYFLWCCYFHEHIYVTGIQMKHQLHHLV